ncbi:MAG TPA: hypothetical protein VGQ09_11435 [Chitinophagaceae bacterium]|jgi:hypothetical protein|nr:hypothetical protein [Chitinophagaceae bacterium]
MYEILYRFLITHKQISLPEIGTIALQMQSAESEFVNHSFLPPKYYFKLEEIKETPSQKLFPWLAANLNISEDEAVTQFNDFVSGLKTKLEQGEEIIWNGVGVLQKGLTGGTKLESVKKELPWLEKVTAKKVIRENAEHTMLVGDAERTSIQMTEILSNPIAIEQKRKHWWVWPVAVIFVILIFLGWYFSEYGLSCTSMGNNHKISPADAPSGNKLAP